MGQDGWAQVRSGQTVSGEDGSGRVGSGQVRLCQSEVNQDGWFGSGQV